jgi:hypothetical protein
LTLQEQQAKLQAEKQKLEAAKRKQYEAQFGNSNAWEGLGSRGNSVPPQTTSRVSTPAMVPTPANLSRTSSPAVNLQAKPVNGNDDDLFAAFNKDTVVDASSHFPPASTLNTTSNTIRPSSSKPIDLSQPQAWQQLASSSALDLGDDDDPFGLNQMKPRPVASPAPVATNDDDDDFLGDLGKPVDQVRRPSPPAKAPTPSATRSDSESDDPWDKAVAELVDMGFSAEQSRRALTESGSGLDVQAAVGWILNDAHRQAKQKQQGRDTSSRASETSERRNIRESSSRDRQPAWQQADRRENSQSRREGGQSSNGDADFSKTAAAVGNNLFKTANSLWKTSQKKVQKAVADFQQEPDSSQPKWMREAAEREMSEKRAHAEGRGKKVAPSEVTDEALMLEAGGRPPARKSRPAAPELSQQASTRDRPTTSQPASRERASPIPRWQQSTPVDPRSRVNKQAIEEQSAQVYISPARRKKLTPQPVAPEPEPEFLFSSSSVSAPQPRPSAAKTSQRPTPTPSKPSTPIPTRPKAPPRQIPAVSSIALQSSTQHRLAGTQHFKVGDYASAHQSYSSSLSALPERHPITIILLCNRALTGLKTGVPKEAVSDADSALALIGVSRGEGESIDLGVGEGGGTKDMKEFYGKALTRKAEALEQMEKWGDARDVWKLAVEHGVGGATAIQGRQRCDKALAPKAAPRQATPVARPKPTPKPRASALSDLNGGSGQDSDAVKRLRAQNQQAEKADDEKFALADIVDARVGQWRDGKRDNLRALIGSLDSVMWEGSGWKKVGMHELITNGKVKINYMKAIGKCHPDKVSPWTCEERRHVLIINV